MTDLKSLFPNSLENQIDVLKDVYLTKRQSEALTTVIDYAREREKDKRPITVAITEEKSSYLPWFAVTVSRNGALGVVFRTQIPGVADYWRDYWKYVLLSHPEPKWADYDTDPTECCPVCKKDATIFSNNKRCNCIPY